MILYALLTLLILYTCYFTFLCVTLVKPSSIKDVVILYFLLPSLWVMAGYYAVLNAIKRLWREP